MILIVSLQMARMMKKCKSESTPIFKAVKNLRVLDIEIVSTAAAERCSETASGWPDEGIRVIEFFIGFEPLPKNYLACQNQNETERLDFQYAEKLLLS